MVYSNFSFIYQKFFGQIAFLPGTIHAVPEHHSCDRSETYLLNVQSYA